MNRIATDTDTLIALIVRAGGLRPAPEHDMALPSGEVVGMYSLQYWQETGHLVSHEERSALARWDMLKNTGHQCFCTALDIPGEGKPCCITGVSLPRSDRATFLKDGGDMYSGKFGDE